MPCSSLTPTFDRMDPLYRRLRLTTVFPTTRHLSMEIIMQILQGSISTAISVRKIPSIPLRLRQAQVQVQRIQLQLRATATEMKISILVLLIRTLDPRRLQAIPSVEALPVLPPVPPPTLKKQRQHQQLATALHSKVIQMPSWQNCARMHSTRLLRISLNVPRRNEGKAKQLVTCPAPNDMPLLIKRGLPCG